ncbi:hypothetical protein G5V58_19860 [Nocardioides anomalus]|uniref:Uncharacterized protein n=1 Tax=Nocardioides anomalus TaxID=2712223 RepID=A0A6G6WHQ2_9ACTN|nr:hypothetical protein [Nocardioides anomalus]QIG44736.1 hypothetical protein G5V58_19860 [Nocardioides anomalus]
MDTTTTLVFVAVVGGRFLLPLLIPYYPLPAVVACLLLDGVDQTIFQLFGHDPPGYQAYDKAMDVYYLSIAFLATLRNWASTPAFRIAWALYFYRLVGALLFELLHVRWLLLVFPNVFEYFFIAYETVRSRWRPTSLLVGWWLSAAAVIWVFVKLPQEWWLHVAELDVTDELGAHTWVVGPLIVLLGGLALAFQKLVRPRLRPTDWDWRFRPEPLPEEIDEPEEQSAWRMRYDAVLSANTAEKVLLLGLVSCIFAQMLPDFEGSTANLFVGVSVAVVLNTAVTLAAARRRWTFRSTALAFAVRLLLSVVAAYVANWFLRGRLDGYDTLFFLTMISLITTLHDRWRPVREVREVLAEGLPVPRLDVRR